MAAETDLSRTLQQRYDLIFIRFGPFSHWTKFPTLGLEDYIMYTKAQLDQYFRHIGYSDSDGAENTLGRLAEIQKRHLARVPFENITLHYSKHRRLSLDLDDLFQKIVIESRGGYCMEVNAFFAAVLRSLGYILFSAGGRVRAPEGLTGW